MTGSSNDEFGLFHENAAEFGISYEHPPAGEAGIGAHGRLPADECPGLGHR